MDLVPFAEELRINGLVEELARVCPRVMERGHVSCRQRAHVALSGNTPLRKDAMPKEPINGREPEFSEEDRQREKLGPRGVPGKEDPAKMTPKQEKNTPKKIDPGHTA